MEPIAIFNLPRKWFTLVLVIDCILSCFGEWLDVMYGWGWINVVALATNVLDILLWGQIICGLNIRRNLLMGLFIAATTLSTAANLSGFFEEDISISISCLGIITYLAFFSTIISSYSGLFKKFAIISIACFIGEFIVLLVPLSELSRTGERAFGFVLFTLLSAPWAALIRALSADEEDNGGTGNGVSSSTEKKV